MMVFVGETNSRSLIRDIRSRGWGRIWSSRRPRPQPGEPWAMDNGAFSAWKHGRSWDSGRWLAKIEEATERLGAPDLAVLPDIVAGGPSSLSVSLGWLPQLPSSWPWYLAVQDGMRSCDIEPHIASVAGLFLGGTTAFKTTARRWCELAHDNGRRFHFGRASRANWIQEAKMMGADSIDSSQGLWSRDHWRRFCAAVDAQILRYNQDRGPCAT